ncbi:MAG: KamA family radical SAM protein [Deltaproteobacteria bacterium]|nr:KamA family radical SAM protein [Deltaproteobacteria bacterium]
MSALSPRNPSSFSKGDWRWQIASSMRSVGDLPPFLVAGHSSARIVEAAKRFPIAITPYYLSLIDENDPADPIRRMAVPSPHELEHTQVLCEDPIAEEEFSPVPGLIRRYPDRAVLLVSGRCAVNCRHCTRRRLGRGRTTPLSADGFERALGYLREHPEIRDVILSGGDPLLKEDTQLHGILEKVRAISTVEIIRIGTRAPVTLPMRITDELAFMLSRFHPLYVNTQFNHPREVTDEAREAAGRLVDAGIPVANQAVLLRGVNDNPRIMEELCRSLLRIRVRPYYLFLCDLWNGIEHLRTSIDVGIEIMEHLRGRLSGLGIPQLIADLSGGIGKVPVGPDYIISKDKEKTVLRAPDGRIAVYPSPR